MAMVSETSPATEGSTREGRVQSRDHQSKKPKGFCARAQGRGGNNNWGLLQSGPTVEQANNIAPEIQQKSTEIRLTRRLHLSCSLHGRRLIDVRLRTGHGAHWRVIGRVCSEARRGNERIDAVREEVGSIGIGIHGGCLKDVSGLVNRA